jgi:hypothetical protein
MQISATEFVQILQLFKDSLPTTSESAIINQLKTMEAKMAQSLAKLQEEVEQNTAVIASAVMLINGLSQQIKDAGVDPVKLLELTTTLDSNSNALAAAITANTPAVPAA